MSKYEDLFDQKAFNEERPKEIRGYEEPVEELEELLTEYEDIIKVNPEEYLG